MICDAFTYNGEVDILDIHLNVLDAYVDQFVIVEATKTFSGKDKELLFERDKHLFEKFLPKIKYHVVDKWDDQVVWDMAEASPNTVGAEHWRLEFYIKEHIKDALKHLKDDDIVFIGDVDEILDLNCIENWPNRPIKAKLDVYTYYLNNRSSEDFWGTLIARYKDIKGECLNHLRSNAHKRTGTRGWHFTSMALSLRKKLTDSYTHESYATPYVLNNLEYNISHGKDFLGRDFTYTLDESEWPQYLKDNREKYKHLLKHTTSGITET